MSSYHFDHLQFLETEAIHVLREVAGEFERPAILFSGGKDSICMLRLAEKAFRPSDIPVLWVDHGYNRPATYKHAEALKKMLGLNLKPYLPKMTTAHRDAICGEIPSTNDEAGLKQFSALMKLEPFQRGMKELAPVVWITALRQVQNPNRAGLDIVSEDKNFGALKVSPVFYWSDADMENYLKQHNLPNEWDYFDPAKADDKRECGLHAAWGGKAVSKS